MKNVLSYTFATVASVLFMGGVAVLSGGKRAVYMTINEKEDEYNE